MWRAAPFRVHAGVSLLVGVQSGAGTRWVRREADLCLSVSGPVLMSHSTGSPRPVSPWSGQDGYFSGQESKLDVTGLGPFWELFLSLPLSQSQIKSVDSLAG